MELVDGDTPMVRSLVCLLLYVVPVSEIAQNRAWYTDDTCCNVGDCQPKQEVQDQQDPARQEEGTKCSRRRCCCRGIGSSTRSIRLHLSASGCSVESNK